MIYESFKNSFISLICLASLFMALFGIVGFVVFLMEENFVSAGISLGCYFFFKLIYDVVN